MSKNYIVFAGNNDENKGGWYNLYGFADTMEEALQIFDEALITGSNHFSEKYNHKTKDFCFVCSPCDWAHIVNVSVGIIVKDSKEEVNLSVMTDIQNENDNENQEQEQEQEQYQNMENDSDENSLNNGFYRDYNYYEKYSDTDDDEHDDVVYPEEWEDY
jgi:hypothetical protein